MTFDERNKIFAELQDMESQLLASKGRDYAGNEEALNNFKASAERYGTTKYVVWLIYAGKHLDAIINAIKANPTSPRRNSESLEESIKDARNYLGLLACLLREDVEPWKLPPPERLADMIKGEVKECDHAWLGATDAKPETWCGKCGINKEWP